VQTEPSTIEAAALGSRLQEARARLGWSLSETAARTGLSRAYINALERGRGKRPGADVIRRLEDVFGPLRSPTSAIEQGDTPSGLVALAQERRIPPTEVRILASLRIRGQQPQSKDRWRFIYDALIASEQMDAKMPRGGAEDRYGEEVGGAN
jgi:transcriptional regulator with XRE-family HTH domain